MGSNHSDHFTYKYGNIFDSSAEAIVNPVNIQGVMGKGLAKELKDRYPENFSAYRAECAANRMMMGRVFATRTIELVSCNQHQGAAKWIVNFPTKKDWRKPSQLDWIHTGLQDLHQFVVIKSISSIAIPALGCGLGGLKWKIVEPMIIAAFEQLDDVRVEIYQPK